MSTRWKNRVAELLCIPKDHSCWLTLKFTLILAKPTPIIHNSIEYYQSSVINKNSIFTKPCLNSWTWKRKTFCSFFSLITPSNLKEKIKHVLYSKYVILKGQILRSCSLLYVLEIRLKSFVEETNLHCCSQFGSLNQVLN